MKTVDARGLSCPQPVMLVREAMAETREGTIEVLVDDETVRDNVSRCARNFQWEPTLEPVPGGGYRLLLRKQP